MLPKTIIHVVTYNEKTVRPCLESMLAQEDFVIGQNFEIIVSDNQSGPETWGMLKEFEDKVTLIRRDGNYGFAGGHNAGIAECLKKGAEFVLVANADLKLEKDFLKKLVIELQADSSAGMASPRLYRADAELNPINPPTLDACGMFFTTDIRHFDRASQEVDIAQYPDKQYVFGATGAAMLLKRSFILNAQYNWDDTKEFELFDNSFFVYREDADLSWRAQTLGWNCLYIPDAIAHHVRLVLPEKRSKLPQEYNRFGVRNRFLMQVNNLTPYSALVCVKGLLFRNLVVIFGCLLIERSSLKGISEAVKLFPNAWKKRRQIANKRRRSELDVMRWFCAANNSGQGLEGLPVLVQKENIITGLAVIIINYNSGERLKTCIEATIKALKKVETKAEIIVVDNASNDFQLENIEVSIIKNTSNLGFSGAINQAAKSSNAESLLIINPDIVVKESGIARLLHTLEQYPKIGAVGATLFNTDNTLQKGFSARRFPSFISTAFEILGLAKLFPNNFITNNYLLNDNLNLEFYFNRIEKQEPALNINQPALVEQPAGACLMLRKSAFDQLNGFDENYFPAWFEDIDYCKRLKQAGWLCAVDSQAQAIHEGGYSLSTMSRAKFFSIWYTNLIKYWKSHGNFWEQKAIRALVYSGIALRGLYFSVRSLTDRHDIPSKNKETANEFFELLKKI
jgi:GT2 family glycosyltransferase